jgi:two-component system, cell cycle sensor histidine kinase and response regulator CckA
MQIPPVQKNILVVDDDYSVLTVIKAMLESSDYDVAVARTADVAVSIAERKNRIDLLLTDVVMPDVDGPNLAQKILAIQPSVKVIFMSGYPLKTYDGDHAEVGFLPKPFNSRTLSDAIERAFGAALQTSVARSSSIFSF